MRVVVEATPKYPSQWAAIESVAGKIGVSGETLRKWVRQSEADVMGHASPEPPRVTCTCRSPRGRQVRRGPDPDRGVVLTAASSMLAAADTSIAGRLLAEHAEFVESLPRQRQAKKQRCCGGQVLLAAHPDLQRWMTRPVTDRLIKVRRLGAWPFLSWAFAVDAVTPDLELLAGKERGAHFTTWARFHAADAARAEQAGRDWDGARSGSPVSGSTPWRWSA